MTLIEVLNIIGYITTIITLAIGLYTIIARILGVRPILLRFGFGRRFRDIAIVAKNDQFSQIESDLKSSGIFKNIRSVLPGSLGEVKKHNLLVVHYESFSKDEIKEIVSYKEPKAGMIFYHPNADTRIPNEMMRMIGNKQNTSVVNFRGRLLNDIITTLLTTSYAKK